MKRFVDLAALLAHIEQLLGPSAWPGLSKFVLYALMRDEYVITAPDGYYWRDASDQYWLSVFDEALQYA